ncbi:DNA-binding response regulator [Azospirillum cavernae]|uniref:DNA-binding response regulator n=1 Tax=Azospirillum cavernae TaxID=2320860 RepID=A0A418W228_9PROT|nr:response regulator [Azospirillum cavernae]RJF84056.1 DNA-binding response regulator [Azospirillum cavernae]
MIGTARTRLRTGSPTAADVTVIPQDSARVAVLEQELAEARRDLTAATQILERGEQVNRDTARRLAVADHDLRQPLQSLALLQPLLVKAVAGTDAATLMILLDQSVSALSARLHALFAGDPATGDGRLDGGRLDGDAVCVAVVAVSPQSLPPVDPSPMELLRVGDASAAIIVIDDDHLVRDALRGLLEDWGRIVEAYPSGEEFLAVHSPGQGACLLIDACLPGMSGLALLRRLHEDGDRLPVIMITGNGDVTMAVDAMKAGAWDFIEKPIDGAQLLVIVQRAVDQACESNTLHAWRESAATHLTGLTQRQRQIMDLVLAGHPSKNIAADLGISQRTVENHRAAIMRKTGSKSLPALTRLVLAAAEADSQR